VERAETWLAELGVEPRYELRPLEPPPAATRPGPGRPTVGLLDLLLLGAPDGKTELIDGRVLRTLVAPSPSEARAVFKQVARELCAFHGLAWRKRFVEGTSRFDVERAHLSVADRTVDLEIEVSTALWRAFCG